MDKKIKIAGILAAIIIVFAGAFFLLSPPKDESVTVYFFYGEECPHCHAVMPFITNLSQKYTDVRFVRMEVWHNAENQKTFLAMNQQLGLSGAGVPEVIINRTVLVGSHDIPDRLEGLVQDEQKKKELNNLNAQSTALPAAGSATPSAITVSATFFYGDCCIRCERVKPFIEETRARYPELDIRMLEIYHNSTNRQAMLQEASEHSISDPGIPLLIIGDKAFMGDEDIRNNLEPQILAEKKKIASSCNQTASNKSALPPARAQEGTTITIPLVVVSALVDSINPCAFSVLVFLLISLVTVVDRRRILVVGGVYVAAVFFLYFLSGIWLLTLVHVTGFSLWLAVAGGIIAIVLGLINIIDTFQNPEEFRLAIPGSKKELINRYIRKASLPAAFVLGIMVGIFELPCTGGIYLAILVLLSRPHTFVDGLPYLVLYNLIFVMPLVVILIIVAFGFSPERINAMRTSYRRLLRLANSLVMVALGAFILLGTTG